MPRTRRPVSIILLVIFRCSVIAPAQSVQDPNPKGLVNQVSQCSTGPHGDRGQALNQRSVPPSTSEKQGPCCQADHGPVINVVDQHREKPTSSSEKAFQAIFWNWVFGWPGFAFFFLMFFLLWPSRLAVLLSPFQSFKIFGTEFVLNRAGGEEVEERLAALRLKEKEKFDNAIALRTVPLKFQKLVEDYMRPKLSEFESLQLRATIHVQDLLFEDALYQLLDYYPNPGSGRGRSFSSRSGIIGKAWRLGKSQYAEVVPVEEERLILDWGMTRTEAERAGHGRQSFGCVVLRNIDDKLGLVYFDSPNPNAFGTDQNAQLWVDLEANITKGAIETGLIDALSALNRDLIRPSAFIRVFS